MTQMGGYNKEEKAFGTRKKDTVHSFPTLNAGALADTIGYVQKQLEVDSLKKDDQKYQQIIKEINHLNGKIKLSLSTWKGVTDEDRLTDLQRKELQDKITDLEKKLLDTDTVRADEALLQAVKGDKGFKDLLSQQNFSTIYAHQLEKISGLDWENLENINGYWKKYDQGSEPDELVDSLEGFPIEWCTRNITTAREQLQGGDFHVYYSQNNKGVAIVPRLAIRMEGKQIKEVRGIEVDQNIDKFIQPVVHEKLKEFGQEGEAYLKKSEDMKCMNEVIEKHRNGIDFSFDELKFIYEIETKIEGFGYEADPRIKEIKLGRNQINDFRILWDLPNLTDTEMVNELMNRNKSEVVGQSLDKLGDVVDHNVIFEKMSVEGKHEAIQDSFTKFKGLKDGSLDMVELTNFESLVKNPEVFAGFSPADRHIFLKKALNNGWIEETLDNILFFKEIGLEKVASSFIEANQAWVIIENISSFDGLNTKKLYDSIIYSNQHEALAYGLDLFPEIDHIQLANQLIQENKAAAVTKNLDSFRGLKHDEIVSELIQTNQLNALVSGLPFYRGVDHNLIARTVMDKMGVQELASDLDKYKNLNLSIAKKILRAEAFWNMTHKKDNQISYLTQYVRDNISSFNLTSKERNKLDKWINSLSILSRLF